jgi:hypothetical protein
MAKPVSIATMYPVFNSNRQQLQLTHPAAAGAADVSNAFCCRSNVMYHVILLQVLLQLNIAYYLPSIPILLLLGQQTLVSQVPDILCNTLCNMLFCCRCCCS